MVFKLLKGWFAPARPALRRCHFRPQLEDLEGRVVPSTLTVGPGKQFSTIQAAVNAAHNSNDTINVYTNTYSEQVVISSRFTSLTLQAATGNTPTIKAPPQNLTGSQAIVDINGATGIVLSGFNIKGPAHGRFRDIKSGVFVEGGGSARIQNNTITNIQDSVFNGGQEGTAVRVGRSSGSGTPTTGTATISNNNISGYQKDGIDVTNTGSSASINNNNITGAGSTNVVAQNGIEISDGARGTVSNNNIAGNVYTGTGNFAAAGILIFQPGSGVSINNNNVTTSDVGIWILDAASPNIANNNISNDTFAAIAVDTAGGSGNTAVTISSNLIGSSVIGLYLANISGASTITTNDVEGNTFGIWLASRVTGATFTQNTSKNNSQYGLLVADFDPNSPSLTAFLTTPATSTGNTFSQNTITSNNTSHTSGVFDASDLSQGSGTAGTGNTWSNNTLGTHNPSGLH
jgi:nitrous oxidase accessory protein NosD